MIKKRALDLFCGAGGASMGLSRAGFEVIGIDILKHPDYPFEFIQGDATQPPVDIKKFDFIWASPMCQNYSIGTKALRNKGKIYPDQIKPIKEILKNSGIPYCIENVPAAPIRKDLTLTGGMFQRNIDRRRIFEIEGFRVEQPKYRKALEPLCTVAGHGGDSRTYKFKDWCKAMGIDWMKKEDLVEAVPPVYSHFIGSAFMLSSSA